MRTVSPVPNTIPPPPCHAPAGMSRKMRPRMTSANANIPKRSCASDNHRRGICFRRFRLLFCWGIGTIYASPLSWTTTHFVASDSHCHVLPTELAGEPARRNADTDRVLPTSPLVPLTGRIVGFSANRACVRDEGDCSWARIRPCGVALFAVLYTTLLVQTSGVGRQVGVPVCVKRALAKYECAEPYCSQESV